MNDVDKEFAQLKSLMSSGGSNSAITGQFDKLKSSLESTQNDLKKTRSEYSLLATEQQRLALANNIEAWNQKNTRATKEVREENQKYIDTLRNLDVEMTKVTKNDISIAFGKNANSMRTLNKLGASLKDQMKQAGSSFTQWVSVSSAIMGLVYNVKRAITELKDLDNILTEISKTSDLTKAQLSKLGDSSFNTASKYGQKASDYLTGVQEMYRAGFNNAPQMAELSVLAQSAGDMKIDSANDYLMATNAAYEYKGSIESLNEVLDRQNYVTNNAAVSMQDMADATSEAASISAQYGVGIDELSAMIATIASKTRESGSEVGTALRSLFVTLQDTTSKPVRDTFDLVGISMTKMVNGSKLLKTPIELLKELSEVFRELPEGDVKRSQILSKIGKKYHANSLAAVLDGWSDFEKMMDLYESNSAVGSAMKEAEKSSNNLQGSLNKLSNQWTATVENIANSNDLKAGVNVLNSFLTVVNKLTDALGLLGTAFTGAGLITGLKNTGNTILVYGVQSNCF
jgi:TP901 family phage tail tape measure protein